MKTLSLKSRLGALALLLGAGSVVAPAASAYTVYNLAENYYAIVCEDGQIFSYSGGPGGIGTVGPALCEGHGGIVGGSGGGLNVERASPALAKTMERCRRGAGQRVNLQTTRCSDRMPARAQNPRPGPAPQAAPQAPAQDYNASRSNKPTS